MSLETASSSPCTLTNFGNENLEIILRYPSIHWEYFSSLHPVVSSLHGKSHRNFTSLNINLPLCCRKRPRLLPCRHNLYVFHKKKNLSRKTNWQKRTQVSHLFFSLFSFFLPFPLHFPYLFPSFFFFPLTLYFFFHPIFHSSLLLTSFLSFVCFFFPS